jgi:hypothetical protein
MLGVLRTVVCHWQRLEKNEFAWQSEGWIITLCVLKVSYIMRKTEIPGLHKGPAGVAHLV